MAKTCEYEGCGYNRFSGPYCKFHQWCRTDKKKPKKTLFSAKRTKINKKEYSPKVVEYLARPENENCAIQIPGICRGKAEVVNHIHGRQTIERLLDEEGWEPSCAACNIEIENQPTFNGGKHKQSKFKTKN